MTEPQIVSDKSVAGAPFKTPRRYAQWLIPVLSVPILLFFGLPLVVRLLFGIGWWRVQILETDDGRHRAVLERSYGGFDTNFCVTLDGRVIHRSWDCRPSSRVPFRETLAWDDSGNVLVFELANEIVFAYDVPTQTEIHPSRFDEITVPTITLSDIGFEGRDELELEKKQDLEPVAVP